MEIQIKKAVKAGNSSAVILPRAWLNKEVRIELVKKTPEIILHEMLSILKKYIDLASIIGIYLVGSYSRGEESEDSDIDILVITKNIDKEMINEGIYSLLIISQELLYQKLNRDLFPIGQMLKEAKPLINADYIEEIEIKATKKNVRWYLETTKERLEAINKILEKTEKNDDEEISDGIAYSLVLRIRTLEIIKKLVQNKNYSGRDFVKLINRISNGTSAYERYLAVKNNSEEKGGISIEEADKLYKYLKKDLGDVKKMLGMSDF